MCGTVLSNHDYRNSAAAVQQWKKFGIDASSYTTENGDGLGATGDFDVSGAWPAQEPWGAGPDLYRVTRQMELRLQKARWRAHAGYLLALVE